MTAGGAEKSQQGHKCFLEYSTFASKRAQVRTWKRQTCFLPRAPCDIVTPLPSWLTEHERHVRITAVDINKRLQKFSQGRKRRYFAYAFHVADDAMHMDSHKTLSTPQRKSPVLRQQSQQLRLGAVMLLFTQCKTTCLTTISSPCLPASPAKMTLFISRVARIIFSKKAEP